MGFIDTIKARAKADKKTIVLPESEDRRTYEAAAQILKEDLANLIIIGSEEAVKKGSEGLDVSKATIVCMISKKAFSLPGKKFCRMQLRT